MLKITNSIFALLLVIPFFSFSQTQIGQDLNGEVAFDRIGNTVSVSADGNRIAIGSRYYDGTGSSYGQVKVYEFNGTTWLQIGNDILGVHNANGLGNRVSISADGNRIAISTVDSLESPGRLSSLAEVLIYEYNGSDWIKLGQNIRAKSKADLFGNAISLSDDGTRVAIGADKRSFGGGVTGLPYAQVYEYIANTWVKIGRDIEGSIPSNLGNSVSLSANGDRLAVGMSGTNRVHVYEFTGGLWARLGQELVGERFGDFFGEEVFLSDDGNKLAVGAHGNDGNGSFSGHVRVFDYSGSTWNQMGSDIDGEAADDISGTAISLSGNGNTVAIGAYRNDGNGDKAGHVRIFNFNSGDWQQLCADIDGNAAQDEFGFALSLSSNGTRVAIGAHQNNDNGVFAGQVTVFEIGSKISGKVSLDVGKNACTTLNTPIENAEITLTLGASITQVYTNTNGEYSAVLTQSGNYTVSINHNGYSETKNITIAACSTGNVVDFCVPDTDLPIDIDFDGECYNSGTLFSLTDTVDTAIWDFGDPISGVNNTSSSLTPTHIYTSPGIYTASVTMTLGVKTTTKTIQIEIFDLPTVNTPSNIESCDDDSDGISSFDTSHINDTILNGQTGMIVKYIDENGNQLSSPLPTPFLSNSQTITARVSFIGKPDCYTEITFNCVVNMAPDFELDKEAVICNDSINLEVNNTRGAYTYEWTFEGNIVAEQSILTVNQPGTYTVKATSSTGCGSTSKEIKVSAVETPSTTIDDITISSNQGLFSITIKDTNVINGNYLFALDDEFGSYQDSPIFYNINPGTHYLYIKDVNSCASTKIEIEVIGLPTIFTPNGDGFHDAWPKLSATNLTHYANAKIYIYDRYGKLLNQISPQGNGWDGTYNGKPMPSSEYWYKIVLESGKVTTGHFTLIR